MTLRQTVERLLAGSPLVACAIYAVALVALLATAGVALADLYASQQALSETTDLLDRLQGRKPPVAGAVAGMTGSPFLEGPTVTVAGAALLQRVTGAVAKAGGTVQSSQVDVIGADAGAVKLEVSCEIEQMALQRLLYDLEAGMPFLFVDQLTVQVPQAVGASNGQGRMRVQLAVSGQWQGGGK